MASWLAIISGLIAIVRAIVQYAHDRNLIDAALAHAILSGLRESDNAIAQAKAARAAAHADNARGDPRLHDDEFERRDGS